MPQERQRAGVGFDNVTAVVIKFEPKKPPRASGGGVAGGLGGLSLGP
jgi:hypothetical protein